MQATLKPKRKYTKRAEKWKHTKKAQAKDAVAPATGAAATIVAQPAAVHKMQDGRELSRMSSSICPEKAL